MASKILTAEFDYDSGRSDVHKRTAEFVELSTRKDRITPGSIYVYKDKIKDEHNRNPISAKVTIELVYD